MGWAPVTSLVVSREPAGTVTAARFPERSDASDTGIGVTPPEMAALACRDHSRGSVGPARWSGSGQHGGLVVGRRIEFGERLGAGEHHHQRQQGHQRSPPDVGGRKSRTPPCHRTGRWRFREPRSSSDVTSPTPGHDGLVAVGARAHLASPVLTLSTSPARPAQLGRPTWQAAAAGYPRPTTPLLVQETDQWTVARGKGGVVRIGVGGRLAVGRGGVGIGARRRLLGQGLGRVEGYAGSRCR